MKKIIGVIISMEKDIIKSTKVTTKRNTYQARQGETFHLLGTTSKEWKPVPIKDIIFGPPDQIILDFPKGYTEVRPFDNKFSKEKLKAMKRDLYELAKAGICSFIDFCQLCGHPIKNLFYLQHDKKKLLLQVGSECVNTYVGAKYVEHQIKTFKENKIRHQFKEWKEQAIEKCNTHKKPTQWDSNHLQYEFWKLREKIKQTNPDTTTSRKLLNLMKKAEKMFGNPEFYYVK